MTFDSGALYSNSLINCSLEFHTKKFGIRVSNNAIYDQLCRLLEKCL